MKGFSEAILQTFRKVKVGKGVLAVDFLSSQAYKTPIMIARDR